MSEKFFPRFPIPSSESDSASRKRRRSFLRRVEALLLIAGAVALAQATGLILILRIVDPPTWMWRLHRASHPPVENPPPVRHRWVDLDDIAPAMQLAVIAAEDQRFPEHSGFDWEAISDALEEHEAGGRLRGASTLTQQTVKNLFLWPSRSWIRKGLEAGITPLVEGLWPKVRILEVYLNIVEFGPNLFGVEAASRHCFDLPAAELNRLQASRLAAVLPNPHRFSAQSPSEYVRRRSRWIRRQMRQLGPAPLEAIRGGGEESR
ncbi:MAG: monofunctional biosynthetic peptidoglycan transglycosylase [Thermodesulfobacteriota bacterium]